MAPILPRRIPSLSYKVLGQSQVLGILRFSIQTEQCQLDLRVPGVPVFLLWCRPESLAQQIHVSENGFHQPLPLVPITLAMRQRGLDQVTGIIPKRRLFSQSSLTLSLDDEGNERVPYNSCRSLRFVKRLCGSTTVKWIFRYPSACCADRIMATSSLTAPSMRGFASRWRK